MRKVGWLVFVAALIGTIAVSALYGQGRGVAAAGGGRGEGPGAGAFDRDRTQLTLELLGLSKTETAAALRDAELKWKARQALEKERDRLRLLADDPQATDQQLSQAIAAYTKAMGSYRSAVQTEDSGLVKQLSVRSRARCLAAGILDNGLGFGRRPRSGQGAGSGDRRRGGPGD